MLDFNSHARVGRDVNWMGDLFWMIISTHTPAWGVTATRYATRAQNDFNSHARVGRDCFISNHSLFDKISTHTPAWGVTIIAHKIRTSFKISTHTPAWGVTDYCGCKIRTLEFQLTRPRGA